MGRLNDLLLLTYVPRWSIIPINRPESVAEHSFRVAVIAMEIAQRSNLETYPVIYRALIHDGPEAATGDIPSPMKRVLSDLRTAEGFACPWASARGPARDIFDHIVKVADLIDLQIYLRRHGESFGGLDRVIVWALDYMEEQYRAALDRLPSDMQKVAKEVYGEAYSLVSPWAGKEIGEIRP
ncbi:MAG: HD domain-containing protein [Nitrospiraceae bacterium]